VDILGKVLVSFFVFCLCFAVWHYEAGWRAYSNGRGYYDVAAQGFRLNEEGKEKGHRAFAWLPRKDKYGFIWLDYYWKSEMSK